MSGAASPSRSSTPFPETPLVIGPISVAWLRLFVFFAALAADRRRPTS